MNFSTVKTYQVSIRSEGCLTVTLITGNNFFDCAMKAMKEAVGFGEIESMELV